MLYFPLQYAYLSLGGTLLFVWLVIFLFDKERRAQQLVISLVLGLISPISELIYIPDYWHPVTIWAFHVGKSYISLEDFLFGFAFIGIMSAVPGLIIPEYSKRHPVSWAAMAKIVVVGAVILFLSTLLWFAGLNSIYASSVAVLIVTGTFLVKDQRRDLLTLAAVGAFGMLALMFFLYWVGSLLASNFEEMLRAVWTLYGTPLGIRFLGLPVTELIFAFSFGSISMLFAKYRV